MFAEEIVVKVMNSHPIGGSVISAYVNSWRVSPFGQMND